MSNCVFVDNVAERGAAFVAEGGAAPTFENCTFVNNTAASGCPETCTAAMRADDVCDAEDCGLRSCGWDWRGACCPAACEAAWADGACTGGCNTTACGYDGGDCCADADCTAKASRKTRKSAKLSEFQATSREIVATAPL